MILYERDHYIGLQLSVSWIYNLLASSLFPYFLPLKADLILHLCFAGSTTPAEDTPEALPRFDSDDRRPASPASPLGRRLVAATILPRRLVIISLDVRRLESMDIGSADELASCFFGGDDLFDAAGLPADRVLRMTGCSALDRNVASDALGVSDDAGGLRTPDRIVGRLSQSEVPERVSDEDLRFLAILLADGLPLVCAIGSEIGGRDESVVAPLETDRACFEPALIQ